MGILKSVTTYGRGLRPTDKPSQLTLRVYTGGLARNEDAERRAQQEFDKYKSANGYSSYEVVSRRARWFPSCVDYVVQFSK